MEEMTADSDENQTPHQSISFQSLHQLTTFFSGTQSCLWLLLTSPNQLLNFASRRN